MNASRINLCVVQPEGNVHAAGFMDQARYFQYQFQRLGVRVEISVNQMYRNAINIIFGAHGGFFTTPIPGYKFVFVNLEQLGNGGASVHPAYIELLSNYPVIDYDYNNIEAYRPCGSIPVISFGYAPYLAEQRSIEIEKRPIELIFFGSVNERRRQMLLSIQDSGIKLSLLRGYGCDRDREIARARAVFNCHYYESARFEQARVFQCLSLGTPVISERTANTRPPAHFENSVFWVNRGEIKEYFEHVFRSPHFEEMARVCLSEFAKHDTLNQFSAALEYVKDQFS